MTSGLRLAIVGATGVVGTTMLAILEARDFPVSELRLLASSLSAGRRMATRWGEVVVEDLAAADPHGLDIALFSAGASRSLDNAPRFAAAGCIVIDNSSAFRMDPSVPLVVADVNDGALDRHEGIVANPNCTTMVLMMAAGPLHRLARLRRIVATSYQAVSGSGRAGIEVLSHELDLLGKDEDALVRGGWSDPGGELYSRPIAYNVCRTPARTRKPATPTKSGSSSTKPGRSSTLRCPSSPRAFGCRSWSGTAWSPACTSRGPCRSTRRLGF